MGIRTNTKSELAIPAIGILNESFLLAGSKVIDKAGGPSLVVVGFTNYEDTITDTGVLKYKNQVYLKVFLNLQRKADNLLFPEGNSNSISSYHFFNDIADDWSLLSTSNDKLLLVCKYWNKEDENFTYVLKSLVEVETSPKGD